MRKAEWTRLAVSVDGAALADEVLRDLATVAAGDADESLSLTEASKLGGYSTRHLSRLLKSGSIPNAGTRTAPRIARSHVPTKPGKVIRSSVPLDHPPSLLAVARSAVVSKSAKRGSM